MVRFDNIVEMDRAKKWLEDEENFSIVKGHFDSTSRDELYKNRSSGKTDFQ